MQKNLRILILILVLTLCVGLFAACGSKDAMEGTMTFVIQEGETDKTYSVDFKKMEATHDSSFLDVLNYLKENEDLNLKTSGTGIMTFIDEIGTLTSDYTNDDYIYIYTSIEKDKDVSTYGIEFTYKETKLYSSGLGIYSMRVQDGCTVLINLTHLSFE
jgi:hypothetical protein